MDFYEHLIKKGIIREENKAPIINGLEWYTTCFFELSTCRSTMSDGPIPFTAIAEFVRIYNINDFEEFLYIVRKMDVAYLNSKEKKPDGRNNETSQGNNSSLGRKGKQGS